MIIEVKAQHCNPSPPHGSIQWRLIHLRPEPHTWQDPYEPLWLFATWWVW